MRQMNLWGPRTRRFGQGQSQVLTHGEGVALVRAWDHYNGRLPAEMVLFVDRLTCPNCMTYMPRLMRALGIRRLIIHTKSGQRFDLTWFAG